MNEKYEDSINVDYLNGFLRCLSNSCHGCNYVPFYGALSFAVDEGDALESLKQFLGIRKYSVRHHREIKNYRFLDNKTSRIRIEELLKKWIDDKLFEGRFIQDSAEIKDFIEAYKDDLFEQIEIIAGKNTKCFYANLEHDAFPFHRTMARRGRLHTDCEVVGITGKLTAVGFQVLVQIIQHHIR